MMSFKFGNTNQVFSLTEKIASSGEGEVWRTSHQGTLAKLYHFPDDERGKKLSIMINHAPIDPNAYKNHVSFAWPHSTFKDDQNKVIGFLMPEIVGGETLVNVCNPRRRKRLGLEIDWRFLHVTARNVAALVQSIHQEGYVLGDIKLQNILVNNRALPSIIDIDSFQVKDHTTGQVYRCPVASEGFTPAELLGKDISSVEQQAVHDYFRLGVVMYYLLFGNHPFQGEWTESGDPPELNEMIRDGLWPYALTTAICPSNRTIPLQIIDPGVQQCFLRCFNEGHINSSARPTAKEWVKALDTAFNKLLTCEKWNSHYYSSIDRQCYWCQRTDLLGIDIFPSSMKQLITLKPRKNSSIMTFSTYQGYLHWWDQINCRSKPLSEEKFYASDRFDPQEPCSN
jgi:DNA-binding helix-hairpin-helix protein with protein kinase domain